MSTENQARGGTFAPADMDVIRNALQVYVDKMLAMDHREPDHPDYKKVVNLQHRLGRIKKSV